MKEFVVSNKYELFDYVVELLNSLARDLDHMLNDLCHDPETGRASNNKNNNNPTRPDFAPAVATIRCSSA
ncbi:hypothetical protein FJT64_012643 [Amphibalanus amphitrite]|uniref:Uncharacterized protein n=1 Tax=Amphibalanus amphitrite TaxID=1232801 RepID=A0A6A4V5P8_AMPAM|nr:hypothetical protein FJT64_012643 [Amphibalanus amphitrite]